MATHETQIYIVKTDSVQAGKGVLVTSSWDQAVADIKVKLTSGPVRVELRVGEKTAGGDDGEGNGG